jgi:hypothetical protein
MTTTTTPPVQIPQQPPDDVLDWLRGRTAADLAAIEALEPCATCRGSKSAADCPDCAGTGKASVPRVFFPDAIRYRDGRGKIVEERVLFTIPREPDLEQATRETIEHVARSRGRKDIDTADAARALIGEVRFASLENAAIVGLCVRNPIPPHVRAYKLHVLIQTFDPTVIADVFNRIGMLRKLWDVRVHHLTEAQFWGFCAEVARVQNTSPLVVLDEGLQEAFVEKLACDLHAYRTCKSCSGCKDHSMPG